MLLLNAFRAWRISLAIHDTPSRCLAQQGILRYITTLKMYVLKIKIKIFFLAFCFSSAVSQSCDSSSDVTQCSDGEICRKNVCESAFHCDVDSECLATPGHFCASDYCQPRPCTSTGQCVYGHVCSKDRDRTCVYHVVYNIVEGSEVKLALKEPATPGSYEDIEWYKGGRSDLNRVAVIHPHISYNKTQYYGDFCAGKSQCRTSDRAHINTDTGELTIHSVQFSDEGFYYYEFYSGGTGNKYEYELNVYVTPELTIEGVPDNYVKVGTNLTLTCTADRIRPKPLAMYWEVNGRNENGTITIRDDDQDGVFTQTNVYMHRVTKDDEGGRIRCILVSRYKQTITEEDTVNPGYGPTGQPTIEVFPAEQYKGENVTLTCKNSIDTGNPPCNYYLWREQKGNNSKVPEQLQISTQNYTFIMNQLHAGNYTCQCSNEFGESDVSDAMDIVYLEERPEMSSETEHTDNARQIAAWVFFGLIVLYCLVRSVVWEYESWKGSEIYCC